MSDKEIINRIKELLDYDKPSSTQESEPRKEIDGFLTTPSHLLEVLNELAPEKINKFIETFLRPIDTSKPYQSLRKKLDQDNLSAALIVCLALVTHDINECDPQFLARAIDLLKDKLSEQLKKSLCITQELLKTKYSRSKKKISTHGKCYLNLSFMDLSTSNLKHADLSNCNLHSAYFSKNNLSSIHLNNSYLSHANLTHTNIQCGQLVDAHLDNSNLFETNLSEANLTNALLANAECEKATLYKANLYRANLEHVNLIKANINNAYLSYVHAPQARFISASFISTDLSNGYFAAANFEKANLENTKLNYATLDHANLTKANLTNAILDNANLDNAKLKNAKLVHAHMKKVSMKNVDLTEAEFFTIAQLKNIDALKHELDWWHGQDNSLILTHIMNDLIKKANTLPENEKAAVFDGAFHHPLFQYKKKSFQGGINRVFSKLDHDNQVILNKTPYQKQLERELLPHKLRRKLQVTRHGISLSR